jgi:uncharacterized protein YjiS (DUF1127 family)
MMNRACEYDAALLGVAAPHETRPSLGASLRGALAHVKAMFDEWRRLSRSRRELATLDAYELKDIGLTKSQAMFESGKRFLQR